jgi:hypothetical protein
MKKEAILKNLKMITAKDKGTKMQMKKKIEILLIYL